ncbi:MAG: glutamate-1-semialdehyde-2,1-aminomutase [Deltaproteobacteria bacterium]|nr:MAG: glutamate-1-semialdehyde-2,1-aminomutase [Deltaproteobacteria bacterium]
MNSVKSHHLFTQARKVTPGGVNSPVRACKSVETDPLFIHSGDGCRITDADGNEYIDYIGSWGPLILGHRHPAVIQAIEAVLQRGTSFGAPTDLETELAELIMAAIPAIDMVRMVNSGTEATMSAIRLARGFTGRDRIIKFDGCYHGHADTLLVEAGSGVATLGIPGSPGVPEGFAALTRSLPFNDLDTFEKVMNAEGDQTAGVIVEPVAGNMGMIPPADGFLDGLRRITEQTGTVLIFDEVMTGFRVAHGGAQALYNITPDLTTLGKVIGGGLPVGAYGGRRDIMSHIAPEGPVYQAGTLSGNPVAMAAGIETLKQLNAPGCYDDLEESTRHLVAGLGQAAQQAGIKIQTTSIGSMFGLFFSDEPVVDFTSAKSCDLAMFTAYYKGMRDKGIYLAPSQFEAGFVSTAHDEAAIEQTLSAARDVFAQVAA